MGLKAGLEFLERETFLSFPEIELLFLGYPACMPVSMPGHIYLVKIYS
jgi:hypothetical protein